MNWMPFARWKTSYSMFYILTYGIIIKMFMYTGCIQAFATSKWSMSVMASGSILTQAMPYLIKAI